MSTRDESMRRGRAIPAVVGVAVTVIVSFAMWRSPSVWTYALDTGGVFLGQTVPAMRSWVSGAVPQWSDLLWGGFPLLGDCTTAALYPLHLVAWAASRTAPLRFFDVAMALHLGIFAAGSAALVRRLGAGPGTTALAGVLAALCPFAHYSAIGFFPQFGAQAWWPGALVAADALAAPATPLLGGAMVLGWIALAAQVLVGVPEQACYSAVVTAFWLLTRGSALGAGARLVRLVVLGAGAAALSAPQLLPTLMLLPWTSRAHAPPQPEFASLWLTAPEQLFIAGTGAQNTMPSFIGLAAPALAVVAAIAGQPGARFLLVLAATAFALATGPQAGLYAWLQLVPPFDHFRSPVKLYALAEFAVVWAAALGAHALWRRRTTRIVAAALVVAALAERAVYLPSEIAAIATIQATDGLAPDALEQLAKSVVARRQELKGPPPFMYDASGTLGGGYAGSLGALVGISSLRAGTVALLSPAHLRLLNRSRPSPSMASVLGVRYLMVPKLRCADSIKRYQWRVVEMTDAFCLLENPARPARFAFIDVAVPVATTEEMLRAVGRRPPGSIPIVAPQYMRFGARPSTLAVWQYAPGRASLMATTPAPALILVRESFSPGWTVRVNGATVVPYPAAGLYFAVPVGGGLSRIELEYQAPGFRMGLLVFLAWTLGATTWLAVRRWHARLRT